MSGPEIGIVIARLGDVLTSTIATNLSIAVLHRRAGTSPYAYPAHPASGWTGSHAAFESGDAFTATVPAADLHGLTRRMLNAPVDETVHRTTGITALHTRFHSLAREDARLVVGDKGSSVALHFRRALQRERELREIVAGATTPHDGH